MGARLALAFSAGMVATVNPCGFALLPAYLTYFLGLDPAGSDATTDSADARRANPSPVLRALVVSAAVTAGFLVVFGVMGLAWSSVSSVIGRRLPWFTLVIGVVPFTILVFILGFFMSLGKAAVYKHIPVYYPDHVGSVGGIVGLIGGLGGFILPISFGLMNDLIGVWTSCFMLLFVLVASALAWMHFAIRRMERARFPEIKRETDLPEIMLAADRTFG